MENKQLVALGIAMQTQVLKACPVHHKIYLDDEVNLDRTFALAVELVRRRRPYVRDFDNDAHQLTGLLSLTISSAPECCPDCREPREPTSAAQSLPAHPRWTGRPSRVLAAVP
jgi:hypothetical protein